MDDDVIAHPDWLHELLKGFEEPSVACVTGLIAPEGPVPHSDEKAARYFASERARSTWILSNTDAHWLRKALGEPVGFGCNMAFRKSFLEKYSLFPEDLGAGSMIGGGDEFWMFVQVLKDGFRIHHNPRAVVTHNFQAADSDQTRRAIELYATTTAFALKLLVEEKGLRAGTARWLLAGLKRRLRRFRARKSILSEPQEPISALQKVLSYLKGPLVYWKSHQESKRRKP